MKKNKLINYIKKILNFIFNIFLDQNNNLSCFQHFNNEKVENSNDVDKINDSNKSNIISQEPQIYDHLYISNDPDEIFNKFSCSKNCSSYFINNQK